MLTFLLGFPLAYFIAFRGGKYKNLLLFLVIAPFFTSFLLRTISWKIILADNGMVLGPLKDLGLIPEPIPAAGDARRGHRRDHLQLPAVHDPAPVRRAREDRQRLLEAARTCTPDLAAPGHLVGVVVVACSGWSSALVMDYGPFTLSIPFADRRRHLVGTLLIGPGLSSAITLPLAAARDRRGVAADVHPGGG